MDATIESDLSTRLALALGWEFGENGCDKAYQEYAHSLPHWWHEDGCEPDPPAIDYTIIEPLLAAIRAEKGSWARHSGMVYVSLHEYSVSESAAEDLDDPLGFVKALALAYVSAKEAAQ